MCHAPETLRDEVILAAIKKLVENKEIKVILIDSGGNVISDISLSALRDALRGTDNRTLTDLYKKAYDSTNDREKISIENDAVGLAKDTTLSDFKSQAYDSTNDLYKIGISKDDVGLAKETTLSNILSQLDITLSALRDYLIDPIVDDLILNNATIDSAGESDIYNIRGAKHVDVLIYVGAPTGSPSITFHLQVIEPTSGKVIRTYDGNQLTAEGADWITVDGLTLGTHVKVTWDGTLDASNYFSGCFVRIVAKR